ncbi:MAG TPA: WecB/TagA/CpsF family glycosyltransferase [Polyangiaceae bacterium LLY-WYZ-14_1]|nr:WecB/TagA/CpsF family glycosyltransferase [Polyangiaceae bacterium LLY-WYZ-14_1]
MLTEVDVHGMALARLTREELLDHLFGELARGRGGWVVTANLDFLRRQHRDPAARALFAAADLRVADGMPLVWASRLQGGLSLPERVAGSDLGGAIAARCAREGRRLYLLGGAPGAAEGAAAALLAEHPDLPPVGFSSPTLSTRPRPEEVEAVVAELEAHRPDVVLAAFGSPKQEHLCRALRPRLPGCWLLGVGITLGFLSGQVRRAPPAFQRLGLEWVHRLSQEPDRLARRYLIDGIPFATVLFAEAARRRLRGARTTR